MYVKQKKEKKKEEERKFHSTFYENKKNNIDREKLRFHLPRNSSTRHHTCNAQNSTTSCRVMAMLGLQVDEARIQLNNC